MVDLKGNPEFDMATTFTAYTNISPGYFYTFRVRASNIYGFGEFSDEFTFKASQEPQQIASDVISTQNDLLNVHVTWQEPDDNESPITAYFIEIRHSDGITFSEASECIGSDPLILSNLECFIPLTTLRTSPYDLVYGDYVVARVRAYNEFGWSLDSQPNTGGATIQTEPIQVTSMQYLPLMSTLETVTVEIEASVSAVASGGYAVDSYHFEVSADDGASWTSLQGQDNAPSLLTQATATGLTGGNTYAFRV